MMYLGTYYFGIDSANRVTVPARFRDAFGTEVILLRAPEQCLYMYDTAGFEKLLTQLADLSGTPGGREKLRRFYADCAPAAIDRTGRFTIPAEFAQYAGIRSEIVLLGAGTRMELWDKEKFTAECPAPEELLLDGYPNVIY